MRKFKVYILSLYFIFIFIILFITYFKLIKTKFLTLNIRGMNEPNKVQYLKDFLENRRVDICFLQETHIDSPDLVEELGNIFADFFCFFTVNFDKTKGVGVLINKQIFDLKIINTFYDIESRFLNINTKFGKYLCAKRRKRAIRIY